MINESIKNNYNYNNNNTSGIKNNTNTAVDPNAKK